MILRLILLFGLIDWNHGGFWPFLGVMVYRSPNWLTLLIIYLAWWGIQTFDCKRHQNALQGNCHLCGSCWSGVLCACVGGSGRSWEIGVRAKGDVKTNSIKWAARSDNLSYLSHWMVKIEKNVWGQTGVSRRAKGWGEWVKLPDWKAYRTENL